MAADLSPAPVYLTNTAESALGLMRTDEAERLLLEATQNFVRGSLATPWMDLMSLYTEQGRLSEALQAMREMLAWRSRQPPSVGIQNWAIQDMAAAAFLLVAGRATEAAHLTARASCPRPRR